MKCRWEKQVQVMERGDGKGDGKRGWKVLWHHEGKTVTALHPSICPEGHGPQQESPNLPPPSHYYQLLRGNPKAFPGQLTAIISPTCPTSTSLEWTPLPRETKCLNLINRFLWRWRSRSSTLRSFRMSELLTPFKPEPSPPPTKETYWCCLYLIKSVRVSI